MLKQNLNRVRWCREKAKKRERERNREEGEMEEGTGRISEIKKIVDLEEQRDLKEAGKRRRQVIIIEVRERKI